jgi:hypothetical protein
MIKDAIAILAAASRCIKTGLTKRAQLLAILD